MSSACERALARSEGRALPEPVAVVVAATDTAHGHNGGPPLIDPTSVFARIDDLYGEAKNWADGEPISTEEMAAEITKLYDGLHAAGKEADDLRVKEKKPHDDAAAAVQDRYNPYVQAKRGRVALGKDALGALLAVWRKKVADDLAAKAEKARREAEEELRLAQELMRASSGNLEAREQAEQQVDAAKQAEKFARRSEKAATTGLGLRSVWVADLTDDSAALDWAYSRDPSKFTALVQQMADEAVRGGLRTVPGFTVREEKVASAKAA